MGIGSYWRLTMTAVSDLALNLRDQIFFIDIGFENNTLFHWNAEGQSDARYKLQIIAERSRIRNPRIAYFIHTTTKEEKIASWKYRELVIIVGAGITLQFQVIEALMEYLIHEFVDIYEDVLRTFSEGEEAFFSGFTEILEDAFSEIPQKHVTKLKTNCRGCDNKLVEVWVKNSLIENAVSHPVSLIYQHEGHLLLMYVDAKYKVRGSQLVEITS